MHFPFLILQVLTLFASALHGLSFTPLYAQGDPGSGIGGYDLKSASDRAFAFDYTHSGKKDHIVLYRPGTGTLWILCNTAGTWSPVFAQGDPGAGIGGYDLRSPADRAFAFDFESSGLLDHIVLYRPGTGTVWILRNSGGSWAPVYAQGDPGNGIGGYDLKSPADRIFAFDYNKSGKRDHLVLYRPGSGIIWILRHYGGGAFGPVFTSASGIGGYDLRSPADRALAYDDGKGLVLYRPGTGAIFVLRHAAPGVFAAVHAQGDPGAGIAGYDLKSPQDRVFAYDGAGLALYRPGAGVIWIVRQQGGGGWAPVWQSGAGIGGYDLRSARDRAFAFDYAGDGREDGVVLYRPGTGAFWINACWA
ncbi:hypothetical protein EDC01DRAFT_732758 [Geopyxis carbonaria]|nr:hypothetical protein EDC01DRAFT_732758 [Geopyxis carbonaria]